MKLWKIVLVVIAALVTIPCINVAFRNINSPSDAGLVFGFGLLIALAVAWVILGRWFLVSAGLVQKTKRDDAQESGDSGDPKRRRSELGIAPVAALLVVVVVIVLVLFMFGCTRIGPGHVGIEVDMAGSQRGVQDFTLKTGWVFYNPASTQIVEYPTYVQTAVWTANTAEGKPINEELTFTTKDSMVVKVDVNLSYRLDPKKVPDFYVMFRSDDLETFTHGYLHNVARDVFNESAGKYSVEQVMGDNGPFLSEVRVELQKRVAPIGVILEQFGLVNAPRPPQGVIDAINLKVQASQIALQKNNEVLQAKADAQKAIARAEGEAESNRRLTASITPQLLEWFRLQNQKDGINRWNGQMPQYTGGGMPLIQFPSGAPGQQGPK